MDKWADSYVQALLIICAMGEMQLDFDLSTSSWLHHFSAPIGSVSANRKKASEGV